VSKEERQAAERYARRTPPLAELVGRFAIALAGRAGSSLLAATGVVLSGTAVLAALMALPEPRAAAPEAIGVDDFAVKRSHRYATVIIDAVTHQRLEVLDGRLAVTLEAWLKAHPTVKLICRDRSTAYAAGARDGAPQAVRVADRWHVWHNLVEAVEKTAIAHRACFTDPQTEGGAASARAEGPSAKRTRARHKAVHALLGQGASHGQIMREPHLSRNTVKKYAAASRAEQLIHGPRYSTTLVDPFRDYLRERRAQEPRVPTWLMPNAAPCRAMFGRSRNHDTANSACFQQFSALLPDTVPRARRLACNSAATKPIRPRGTSSMAG
jgi:DNA-binding NarL/FixJ family response regulator